MGFVIEEIPLGDRRLRGFVAVQWAIQRGDPNAIPPLRGDLLGNRFLGLVGLLTPRHPYHRHAEVTHFLARSGRRLLGRVSAAVTRRFDVHYGRKIGFFGLFECVEDFAVARALLDRAREWLLARGMEVMRGPGGYSNATHEPYQAVLVDGFDTPPTVELTHNPPITGHFWSAMVCVRSRTITLTGSPRGAPRTPGSSASPGRSRPAGTSRPGPRSSGGYGRRWASSSPSTTRHGRPTGGFSPSPRPKRTRWPGACGPSWIRSSCASLMYGGNRRR